MGSSWNNSRIPSWVLLFSNTQRKIAGSIRDNTRKQNVTNFEGRVFLKFICQETFIHLKKRRNLWSFGLCYGLKDAVRHWEEVFSSALNTWKVGFESGTQGVCIRLSCRVSHLLFCALHGAHVSRGAPQTPPA